MTSATVAETESLAYCAVSFGENEAGVIYTYPLSKEELAAYRRHPDTLFGVPSQRKTEAKTPLDLYDFFHESYRHTPKAKLLEFMNAWPNQAHLATLGQAELASMYAEALAVSAWNNRDS